MSYKYKIALSFATENQDLVERVYHYLRAEKINVFFAPSSEAQVILSGKNQREVFYSIFGMDSEYVALFVSKQYVAKEIPMEEARIAFARHTNEGKVIPIYLDGTSLPENMFNPKTTNYFKSDNPTEIASHLASRVNKENDLCWENVSNESAESKMNISGNVAEKQIIIQTMNGNIEL